MMKYLLFLISLISLMNNGSAQTNVIEIVENQLQHGKTIYIDINKTDSITQLKLIEYLKRYNTDTTIKKMRLAREFVGYTFYKSKYLIVKQQAVNYLLDLHRCYTEDRQWNNYNQKAYFDNEAITKIRGILLEEPFTDFENDIHRANSYENANQYWSKLSDNIRIIARKEKKDFNLVKDSLVNNEVNKTLKNITPRYFICNYIIILAGWLEIEEVIPSLNSRLINYQKETHACDIKDAYKYAIACLGDDKIQQEIIDECVKELSNENTFDNILYDYTLIPSRIGYIATQNSMQVLNLGLKSKLKYNKPSVTESIFYSLNGLYLFYITKYIRNFPYDFGEYNFNEKEFGKKENINKAIKWMDKNKGNYQINNDIFIWPLE